MLGEIIKELTASRGNDQITSGNVLTWAKRVESQRTQAAVINSITESNKYDKIKVSRSMHKESPKDQHSLVCPCSKHVDTVAASTHLGNAWHMARCAWNATRLVTSRESVGVRRPEQYRRWSRRPYKTRPEKTLKC